MQISRNLENAIQEIQTEMKDFNRELIFRAVLVVLLLSVASATSRNASFILSLPSLAPRSI